MANQSTTRQMGTGPITEKAREAASTVAEKGKEMASSAAQTAQEAATHAGQRADEATASVGHGIRSFAGALREKLPHEGMLGSASSTVADTLDRSGRYLEEEGLRGLASDVTDLVRRYPIPALLIGLGIGYLIARSLRS
jgi:hypothetical protein